MENNFGFDYRQHPHMLPRDQNFSGFPLDSGLFNADPVRRNPNTVEDFTFRNLLSFPVPGMPHLKASEPNNSQNWFHLKPMFDFGQQRSPMVGTLPVQKKFLVFDQSGDKTTLLYSSGAHAPFQFGAYRVPNPPTTYDLDTNHINDENFEDYSRDEMREDSEELDALLCSDYDTDYSEDDETSTGHSPSTMTDNGVPDQAEEAGEEVDSFSVPTKKRKLPEVVHDVPSLKTVDCSTLESDAESSCGNGKDDSNFFSSSKRPRKEKIQETVSILQSIVPNAHGKDAIVVIDEAIRYFKSLKPEAKAFELDTV